jgi:biotin carboxylase
VLDHVGLPLVVKPTMGSGSVGVRRAITRTEVADAIAAVLATGAGPAGGPRRALAEEYLEGPEFSVEMVDDEVVAVVGKHLGDHPYFVEIGHDVPADLDADDRAAIESAARRCVEALGLT